MYVHLKRPFLWRNEVARKRKPQPGPLPGRWQYLRSNFKITQSLASDHSNFGKVGLRSMPSPWRSKFNKLLHVIEYTKLHPWPSYCHHVPLSKSPLTQHYPYNNSHKAQQGSEITATTWTLRCILSFPTTTNSTIPRGLLSDWPWRWWRSQWAGS